LDKANVKIKAHPATDCIIILKLFGFNALIVFLKTV
jgi:hypothetical protein